MELVIASCNSQKVLELRTILKELVPELQVLSLFDFPAYKQIDAKTSSFEENAKEKALHAAKALQKVCLSDDSGIVVPSLGKIGSTLQRRYQSEKNSAVIETKKLLHDMQSLKDVERHAYLECAIAVASPDEIKKVVSARSEGVVAEQERGKLAFEFDTIFIKCDYGKTIGELPRGVRERISHRRKAIQQLLPTLEQLTGR